MHYPILYSYRRCPYAMRARMALVYSGITVALREISFRNKPQALLTASPKGTVPVLVFSEEQVLEESLEIMDWALAQNDPEDWKGKSLACSSALLALIAENDIQFKPILDCYKYPDRALEHSCSVYRAQALAYLRSWDQRLMKQPYLFGNRMCYADIALFPFVRQCVRVDETWFREHGGIPHLLRWLDHYLDSTLFAAIMQRYATWSPGVSEVFLTGQGER